MTNPAPEKPTAAFVLSLIAGLLVLIHSVIIMSFGGLFSFVPFFGALILVLGLAGLVMGVLIIIGSIFINSNDSSKVRTGGILVLIFSIVSLFFGGGFFLGFILGLIGGILALTWKPS